MAEFIVDSWNRVQLERLQRFFADSAKEGDVVVFDRTLAVDNARPLEGLDNHGCNKFVYDCADKALLGIGLGDEDIKRITKDVTLTTRDLSKGFTLARQEAPTPAEPEAEPEDDYYDLDLDLMEPEVATNAPQADAEAEWAATLARYHNRHHEMG